MGITWEAEVAAQNRSGWRWSVAECIHHGAIWSTMGFYCLYRRWWSFFWLL